MFQIATAFELQVGGRTFTLSVGWGTASVPGRQLYVPLFGLFNQQAVGAQRYGATILGFYVTLQIMDIAKAAASVQRQMQQASGPTSALAKALRNTSSVGAMPAGPVKVASKPAPRSTTPVQPVKATDPNAQHIDVV